jgi:hypothetical protein
LDESVTATGFKALSKLQHLEQFDFRESHCRDLSWLCLQYLPNLRFVGDKCNPNSTLAEAGFGSWTTQWMQRAPKPVTLGLQEVTLLKVMSLPEGVLLPNLTFLILQEPPENFKCDQRLSTVSKLLIHNVSVATCVHILQQIGRQLKKLIVHYVDSVISVDQILSLCPNLELLSFVVAYGHISLASDIKLSTLRQLKTFVLYGHWYAQSMKVDFEVLLQLLQAPELRKLNLSWLARDPEEVDTLIAMLQQREILQKLEAVNVGPYHFNSLCYCEDDAAWEAEYDQVSRLLSAMVLNCPNLVDVKS